MRLGQARQRSLDLDELVEAPHTPPDLSQIVRTQQAQQARGATLEEVADGVEPALVREPSRVQLCAALMRRVPVEVERHWSGTGTHSYMLRLYRPGGRSVKGPSFHVERSPPPVPTALAPIVVALNGENLPEARVWRALGAAVEDFVGTVVRSVTGLMDAEHRVNEHLADQRAKSWRLIEALSDPGRSGGLRAMLQDPLACEALARHLLEVARDIGELGP